MNKKFYTFICTLLLILCINIYTVNAQESFTPNELSIYMIINFAYKEDVIFKPFIEYIQSPIILEKSKTGDCDDFAVYSNFILNKLGYYSCIYCIWEDINSSGHAITVFLDKDNTYSIFSNQFYYKTDKIDPIEAIKDIYPKWQLITKFYPVKYGYITYKEFINSLEFCEGKDVKTIIQFFADKIKGLL